MRLVTWLALIAAAGTAGTACAPHDPPPRATQAHELYVVVPRLAGLADADARISDVERAVANLPGVVATRSLIEANRGVVALRVTGAPEEVRSAVLAQLATRKLTGASAVPAGARTVRYALHAGQMSLVALRALQDTLVRPRLARVAGVVEVATCGGRVAQWQVRTDGATLAAAGVTVGAVGDALSAAMHAVPAGGGASELQIESFAPLIVAMHLGAPVRVRDVATLTVGEAEVGCEAIDREGSFVEGVVVLQPAAGDRAGDALPPAIDAAFRELAGQLPAGATLRPLATAPRATLDAPPGGFAQRAQFAHQISAALAGIPSLGYAIELGRLDAAPTTDPGELTIVTDRELDGAALASIAALQGLATAGDPVLRVFGPEPEQLAHIVDDVRTAAASVPGVQILRPLGVERVAIQHVEVDHAAATRVGVSDADAAAAVAALDDRVVGQVHTAGGDVEIVVSLGARDADRGAALATAGVGSVPLSAIARVTTRTQPRAILHASGRRWAGLQLRFASVDARLALVARLAKLPLPAGYELRPPE